MKSSCFKIMSLVVAAALAAAGAERAVVTGGKAVGLVGENGAKVEVGDGCVVLSAVAATAATIPPRNPLLLISIFTFPLSLPITGR